MAYPPKIEGQPCSDNCGGKNIKNPKTGKIFCENKCWLKGQTNQSPPAQNDFVENLTKAKEQEKWDSIAEGKVRHGFAIEAYKAGKQLTQATIEEVNNWTAFVIGKKERKEPPTKDNNFPIEG